jgi:hypothetical protein
MLMTAPIHPAPDDNAGFLNEVRAALRRTGRLLPATDEEVEQALDASKASDEDLEAHLSDPYELFRTGEEEASPSRSSSTGPYIQSDVQDEVDESMALAAREGEDIPPEIREKMSRDREEAEENQQVSSDDDVPDDERSTDEDENT